MAGRQNEGRNVIIGFLWEQTALANIQWKEFFQKWIRSRLNVVQQSHKITGEGMKLADYRFLAAVVTRF